MKKELNVSRIYWDFTALAVTGDTGIVATVAA